VRSALLAASAVTLALGLTGCTATHSSGVVSAPLVAPSADVPLDPTVAAPPAPAATEAGASPSVSPSPTRPPAPTYDVAAVERQLAALHYYGGAVDGQPGPSLASAVMAFQKVQGIGTDGVVGKGTLAALKTPRSPALQGISPSDRVEVDLTRQVLYVVKAGAVVRILPVSSGNGATYLQKNGSTATALSPVGHYVIQRRIIGAQEADLGTLYDPQYFYRGWAIHGSNSVPAYPASHGCIRVTRADAKYLLDAIGVGTSVYVYGGRYTFPAGSSAAGTDNPTGDSAAQAPVSASPSAAASPSPSTKRVPASPSPPASASPSPSA
jgi:peptidoglycan hydrolase-like protein with peptidoglycan-binding domain